MIKRVSASFVGFVFLGAGMIFSAHAEPSKDTTSSSMFGLPTSVVTPPSQVVGSLPYSNQWISEKTSSYLYVSFNSAELGSQTLTVGNYTSNFGGSSYSFPSIDYFSHLASFAGPESNSSLRDFALWGRYSLGFADRSGQVTSSQSSGSNPIETNSLLLISARIGAVVGYDRFTWIKPYAGLEIDPYFFRNTSDVSGAEQQGESFSYGPVIGFHLPVFFGGKASILGEYRRSIAVQGSGQLFANFNNYSAGLGLAF